MTEERKKEIIRKIQTLQNEQDELLLQLERLNINSDEKSTTSNNKEDFKIGDNVIILNPGRFQERSGSICKIGKQITILTKKGRKIVRAKKNVQKVS
jgi:hypothetical protein